MGGKYWSFQPGVTIPALDREEAYRILDAVGIALYGLEEMLLGGHRTTRSIKDWFGVRARVAGTEVVLDRRVRLDPSELDPSLVPNEISFSRSWVEYGPEEGKDMYGDWEVKGSGITRFRFRRLLRGGWERLEP